MTHYEGIELLRRLCLTFGPTGCEDNVAELIASQIEGYCDDYTIDKMGNLIAVMRCGRPNAGRIMLSSHMDEVGFMVREIDDKGYIKFSTLGGIDPRVLSGRHVTLGDEVNRVAGVIASKAIHHRTPEERTQSTPVDKMYIDIGAKSCEEAEKYVNVGDFGTFDSDFELFGEGNRLMKGKAIDDRLGCAIQIEVMRRFFEEKDALPHDLYFAFTVREEVGLSGAQVAANRIEPDFAIVFESTAIADIADVAPHSRVADVGSGGVISLLDRATIYDRDFVAFAMETAAREGIPAQIKRYVSGGNDAGHIHKSGKGVRSLAISAATRYLHSASCVASVSDFEAMKALTEAMLRDWRL